MYYLFVDERSIPKDNPRTYVIGCIAMSQERWNSLDSCRRLLKTPKNVSRHTRIETLLNATCGIGTLAYAHREELRKLVTQELTQIMQTASAQGDVAFRETPCVRRFEEVSKPDDDSPPDKFQAGTQASHQLCDKAWQLIGSSIQPPIYICDNTDTVVNTLLKFEQYRKIDRV